MFKQKLLIAFLVPLFAIAAGCGGDDGDNVTINIDAGEGPAPTPTPTPPPGGGDCDTVVEAEFVEFNDDCSVGTLFGTVNEDSTLTSDLQWRLADPVTVGDGNLQVATVDGVEAI